MSDNSVIRYGIHKLQEDRAYHAEYLATGRVDDFTKYNRLCGVIQGLDHAIETLKDLANKLETAND